MGVMVGWIWGVIEWGKKTAWNCAGQNGTKVGSWDSEKVGKMLDEERWWTYHFVVAVLVQRICNKKRKKKSANTRDKTIHISIQELSREESELIMSNLTFNNLIIILSIQIVIQNSKLNQPKNSSQSIPSHLCHRSTRQSYNCHCTHCLLRPLHGDRTPKEIQQQCRNTIAFLINSLYLG